MVSQSIVATASAPGIVYVGGETVVPEANAGEEFDLAIGPIYLARTTDAQATTLDLQVESSGVSESGTLRLSFVPITVETTDISFATPPDEDRPGSSEGDSEGSGLAGPDDRLELLVRTGVTQGFAPTLGPVTFAFPADGSVFSLDAMGNQDFAPDAAGAGRFISVDDLDIHVGPRTVFQTLDLRTPVALARLRGNRVARVQISVSIDSPTTLATVAQGLAPAAVLNATGLLAQRQGITAPAAFAALTRAGTLLSPVTTQLRTWEQARSATSDAPDDGMVAAALVGLRSAHLISATSALSLNRSLAPSDPRALWAVDVMEHLEMLDSSSAAALRANAVGRRDRAMSDAVRRRLCQWSTLATLFTAEEAGANAAVILSGVDVLTADPTAILSNATVLRNALTIALAAPLRSDAAVAVGDERRIHHSSSHSNTAEAAAPLGVGAMGPMLAGVAAASATTIAPLPTWSFQRYVLLPIESAP